jgi:glycosyltransferase involved in cell wall biosynthesis
VIRRLHQFVPTLDPGAVGTHVMEAQRLLRADGWESEVFAEHTKGHYDGVAIPFTDYGKTVTAHPGDVVIYHAAIGSSVADWLVSQRVRRLVVDYHNVTPPSWFEGWEPDLCHGLAWGRAQLAKLGRACRIGLADSAFNAGELHGFGFRQTEVLPILVDPAGRAADPAAVARLRAAKRSGGDGAQWLFVGRLAPNKCQADVVKAFALYRRAYDPSAHLWLVGGNSSDGYADAVRRFATDAGVGEGVTLTGAVSEGELGAHYATADVFVCLSEHEGFCVPLLEAWQHDLPVIAYAAAAVPETLGAGGLLLTDKSPTTVAAAVRRVVTDAVIARGLAAAGRCRLDAFSPDRTARRLLDLADGLGRGMADRPGLARSEPAR